MALSGGGSRSGGGKGGGGRQIRGWKLSSKRWNAAAAEAEVEVAAAAGDKQQGVECSGGSAKRRRCSR